MNSYPDRTCVVAAMGRVVLGEAAMGRSGKDAFYVKSGMERRVRYPQGWLHFGDDMVFTSQISPVEGQTIM